MPEVLELAYKQIDEGREGRVSPVTAASHTDEWSDEASLYIAADIARGDIEKAQGIIEKQLSAHAESGRLPHMIIDTSSMRRRFIDGPGVQQASWQRNGHMISPLTKPANTATSVERLTQAVAGESGNDGDELLERALPVIEKEKRWRYAARDIDGTGLPVQIHPDELLFRHSPVVAQVLERQPGNWLTRLEAGVRDKDLLQEWIRGYRRWQGDDQRGTVESTYDPSAFMKLDTAAGVYSALGVALRSRYSARRIINATNKNGQPTGFLMQDVASSSLLVGDNENLLKVYERLDRAVPADIQENIAKTKENFGLHWSESEKQFVGRLPRTGEHLPFIGAPESLLVLHAAEALTSKQRHVTSWNIEEEYLKQGSYALASSIGEYYDPAAIHRGAVDPMLNFFVADSVKDLTTLAPFRERLANDLTDLVTINGGVISRGYDANNGEALGQRKWNPSAAAIIALAHK